MKHNIQFKENQNTYSQAVGILPERWNYLWKDIEKLPNTQMRKSEILKVILDKLPDDTTMEEAVAFVFYIANQQAEHKLKLLKELIQ